MIKPFVKGNPFVGYWVELGDKQPLLMHNDKGEFSAVFSNADETASENVDGWRAQHAETQEGRIVLDGVIPLTLLQAVVNVRVIYTAINETVISKEITLSSNHDLKYWLINKLQSKVDVEQYWTFEDDNPEGGPIYEIFPAIGMQLQGKQYGLLTDNGFQNRWTRISRQKDADAYLVGLEKQPDAELTLISSKSERAADNHFVQFKFGEYLDFTEKKFSYVSMPERTNWRNFNQAIHAFNDSNEVIVSGSAMEQSGIEMPLKLQKNTMYEIEFTYRSSLELAVRLMDANSASYFEWAYEYGAFRDNIPATSEHEYKTFSKYFYSSRFKSNNQPLMLRILSDGNATGPLNFTIQELRIRQYEGKVRPFHTVAPCTPASLRLFVFESSGSSHREVQIAAQVALAEGLGFTGTEMEKIMYADNQMQIWIAEHEKFVPHLVPNLNYHPDMYLRDAFWHAQAIDDKAIAEQCWLRYAETQHEDGQLDTLVMPYYHRLSRDDNDSTMFFLMWAYINHKKYGTPINHDVVKKTFQSILENHCSLRNGIYLGRTAGWLDTIWNTDKIRAINQGHFAVTLQCAHELGLDVTMEEINLAKDAYRALYDHDKRYVQWSEDEDYLSPSVLLGEFMNLWLFNQPILSDDAVINTVERLPVIIRGVPCICDAQGQFFTEQNKPWEGKYTWKNGVYHNGGSWFLYEYLAYVTAGRHGWKQAQQRMDWRLEMEFSKENQPYSHEFIPLSDDEHDWWPTAGVFAWNTFMIVANKVSRGYHL